MNQKSRLSRGDYEAILGPGRQIKPDEFQDIVQKAVDTSDGFQVDFAKKMTRERAARIRELRVDKMYSWRAVAEQCFEEWGEDGDWYPSSNQLAGVALCKIAAAAFGEDCYDNAWN